MWLSSLFYVSYRQIGGHKPLDVGPDRQTDRQKYGKCCKDDSPSVTLWQKKNLNTVNQEINSRILC